jgi:hypothetical protein
MFLDLSSYAIEKFEIHVRGLKQSLDLIRKADNAYDFEFFKSRVMQHLHNIQETTSALREAEERRKVVS